MSPLGEAFRRAMEKKGAAPRGVTADASPRAADVPARAEDVHVPSYPGVPPAGGVAGEALGGTPEPVFESAPAAPFASREPTGGASAFLSRATRVATFAEGPLAPGCDDLAGLRAALVSLGLDRTPATVMVAGASPDASSSASSSASSGDATTAVAVGLAGELSRDLSHQVLLLDANVGRPRAAQVLDVDPAVDLADVLEGRAFAGEAVVHSETDNLSALLLRLDPVLGRSRATAESFLSEGALQVLAELQAAFDYVVIDAGEVGRSAVARVLAARAAGTVLVLERGVAAEEALAAKRAVEGAGGRVLGAVLAGGRAKAPSTRASRRNPMTGALVTAQYVPPAAGAAGPGRR